MNLAQYKIDKRLAPDALTSLSMFASIEDEVMAAGKRSGSQANDSEIAVAGSADIEGATLTYGIGADDRAHILECSSEARAIEIPERIGGHEVGAIGPHAFCTCYSLEHIGLPDSIASIERHAFMNAALCEFTAPQSLRVIGESAFYKCAQLRRAALNGGLRVLGPNAFRESALESLVVPASVEHIGHNAFRGTKLAFCGPEQTLVIDPQNENLLLEDGVLYARTAKGLTLVQALDESMEVFDGKPGIAAVAAAAFANRKALVRASLPEGTLSVGDKAFAGCMALEHVRLPNSLRSLGKRVFQDTILKELRIPAALEEAGHAAFYTGGSIAHRHVPTIGQICVDSRNEHFFVCDGILCCRDGGENTTALLYAGRVEHLVIPREVTKIGAYAFLNCSSIHSIDIHDGVRAIDVGGLDTGFSITSVTYRVYGGQEQPQQTYVVTFPPGYAGRQAAKLTFARGVFDLAFAFAAVDDAIFATQDTFARAKAILERLENPVLLDEVTRAAFEKRICKAVPDTIVAMGKNGYTKGIDMLLEVGALNQDNIDTAIEAASAAGEIAALSRLMELKRTSFGARMFDFDL